MKRNVWKRFIAAVAVGVLASGISISAMAASYPDVGEGDWYHKYVMDVSDKGLVAATMISRFNSNNSNETIPQPHEHEWQSHDAIIGHNEQVLVSAAWDEKVYERKYICNQCSYYTDSVDDIGMHIVFGPCSNYRVGDIQTGSIHHEAVYENKWVEPSLRTQSVLSVVYINNHIGSSI